MSVDRCCSCDRLVDTDYDCEFYEEDSDEGMCGPCRDASWAEQLLDWKLDGRLHL